MEVTAAYPGSFGEIVQGKMENRDILLSCPVDVYTEVKLTECHNPVRRANLKKSSNFLFNILKSWGYEKYYKNIDIEINSQIPQGKGLASSTADLCGVYYCLIDMFNRKFNELELVRNCVNIEPTDSIIFKKMTLFDYKNGKYSCTLGDYLSYDVLAFEGYGAVDTVEFNHRDLPELSDVTALIPVLKEAVEEKNLEKLAYVSTESIIKNQGRLYYEFLDRIIDIKKRTSGLGIMGAHSGNALGIIYKGREEIDFAERISQKLNLKNIKLYKVKTLKKIST
ncbi:GHMP family kinase ATP-binding protein [Clostridium luticellarii]|uniref:L-threonine kinase n=1 Tax=Clostridium luticellarii TaxID=1691940 RepID=A0A2T0BMK0_9CLOT|nr:kinase [Clostridium luticellarii]MCI1945240.1 kinase [Clostridium luticellarii]MCI1969654.1 kinase [Clostridium luticellarii]MCI1994573.1 kinase [Clostridium luticellarii]MCI2038930.1 kinase [Clostridium luticellarii]PRR85108.1 L-threonine kinase [Clostridium luticellarii]